MMKHFLLRSVAFGTAAIVTASVKFGPAPALRLSPPHAAAASNAESAEKQSAALFVTDQGFTPKDIKVKRGVPVELVITRKTDETCARAIHIPAYGIKQELPLNEPVTVGFTPKASGEIKYACGMAMMEGVIVVE